MGVCRKSAGYILSAVMMMVGFSGCAEKKVDYDVESLSQNAMTAESSSGAEVQSGTEEQPAETVLVQDCGLRRQFPETHWKEKWEAEDYLGRKGHINIDAGVTVPDADAMSVIEVSNGIMNADYKEQFIRDFFDSGSVRYYDDAHKTKEQWQYILKCDIEPWVLRYENWCDDPLIDRETLARYQESLKEYEVQKTACEEAIELAPAERTAAESFEENEYIAQLDGAEYIVTFKENSGLDPETGVRYDLKSDCIIIQRSHLEEIAPEEIRDAFKCEPGTCLMDEEGENRCRMTLEEAKTEAERYLAAAGLEGASFSHAEDMQWYGWYLMDYETVIDGYVLQYELTVDGFVPNSWGGELYYGVDCYEKPEMSSYSMDMEARVMISDEGLLELYVTNPVSITNITREVNLLPFDSVCDIMRETLRENEKKCIAMADEQRFQNMELIYFRLKDRTQENHYSFVPVWRLSRPCYDTTVKWYIMVNAIDGSVIWPEEEY